MWHFGLFKSSTTTSSSKHPRRGVRELGLLHLFNLINMMSVCLKGSGSRKSPQKKKKKITVNTWDTRPLRPSASPVTYLTAFCENKDGTFLMTCIYCAKKTNLQNKQLTAKCFCHPILLNQTCRPSWQLAHIREIMAKWITVWLLACRVRAFKQGRPLPLLGFYILTTGSLTA